MDRIEFCEQAAAPLVALRDELSRRAFPPPSTLAAARAQDEEQARHAALLARTEAALAKIEALRVSTAPRWDAEKDEIDRELAAIAELRKRL